MDKDDLMAGGKADKLSLSTSENFFPEAWPLLFLRCRVMKAHPPVNYLFHTMRHAEIKPFFFFESLKFRGEHYAKVPKLPFVSPAIVSL